MSKTKVVTGTWRVQNLKPLPAGGYKVTYDSGDQAYTRRVQSVDNERREQ